MEDKSKAKTGKRRGKEFEKHIRDAFEKVPNVSIQRLPDQTAGYAGAKNPADFVLYRYPRQYLIECKAISASYLNFEHHVTDYQWGQLLEKDTTKGVVAGIVCWFISHDITLFIPIKFLEHLRSNGAKSFHIKWWLQQAIFKIEGMEDVIAIPGRKKQIYFDYDMETFFAEVDKKYGKL